MVLHRVTASSFLPCPSGGGRFPQDSLYYSEGCWRMIRIGEGPLGFGEWPCYCGNRANVCVMCSLSVGVVLFPCTCAVTIMRFTAHRTDGLAIRLQLGTYPVVCYRDYEVYSRAHRKDGLAIRFQLGTYCPCIRYAGH